MPDPLDALDINSADDQHHSQSQNGNGNLVADFMDLAFQRGFFVFKLANQRGQPPHATACASIRNRDIAFTTHNQGSTENLVPLGFIRWNGLPGKHGFIHQNALTSHHQAVRRDAIAGLDTD